jgi:AP-3 complex subunit delta-1
MYFLLGQVTTSEEEEEDVAPLHIVNTDIGEMPEGAQVSDGEELDSRPNDDPHKALDINLDEYVLRIVMPHCTEQLQLHTCS